jgi:hypothetical protein
LWDSFYVYGGTCITRTEIEIEGVSSIKGAAQISRALASLPSVRVVRVSDKVAIVEHEGINDQQLINAIRIAGNYQGQILKKVLRV